MTELEFIRHVLRVTAQYETHDQIWWHEDGKFFVKCNDLFVWACADCEPLTPENLANFEKAHVDASAAGDVDWGPSLFCARVRKERPQGAAYPKGDDKAGIRALLNACGPERAIDLNNPKPVPARVAAA